MNIQISCLSFITNYDNFSNTLKLSQTGSSSGTSHRLRWLTTPLTDILILTLVEYCLICNVYICL